MKPPPPTKKLFQYIKRREWDRAKIRTLMYPWDAHFCNSKSENEEMGRTPMHLVCLYRAPIDVVEILLDANPSALFVQDSEGWTPIHLVLLYGGEQDVALLLIKRGGPNAVSLLSPIAGSPLHIACRHPTPMRVLEELIEANLDMATTPNDNGCKPAEVVWHQFTKNPRKKLLVKRKTMHKNTALSSSPHAATDHSCSSLDDVLLRFSLLLQAVKKKKLEHFKKLSSATKTTTTSSCNGSSPMLIMHELLSHQDELGDLTGFMKDFIQFFPEHIQIKNQHGNFLLHIAASLQQPQSAAPPSSTRYNLKSDYDCSEDSVSILVRLYPIAARYRNKFGDLPLHLALRRGDRKWISGGISSLVDAYPGALCVRDRKTKLYPFQLAATTKAAAPCNPSIPIATHEEGFECLETVFELLLAAPHVLKL